MKQFIFQRRVKGMNHADACLALEELLMEKGAVEQVFNVNEVPKSVPTVNVIYIEDGEVQIMISFRNDLEGHGLAESCFEFLASKLEMLVEESDDEGMMMEIAEGLEKGSFVKDNKMLFMVESMPMEDVDHMQEVLEALEDEDDYSGMAD